MIAEVADETEATLATETVTAEGEAGPTLARKETVVIVAAVTLEDVDEAEVRTEASPAAEVKRHHEKFNSIHNTWVHYVLLTLISSPRCQKCPPLKKFFIALFVLEEFKHFETHLF